MSDGLAHSADARARVAVLISGRGSNMTALIDAAKRPGAPFEVAGVISNEALAPGLTRAAERGVPTAIAPHRAYPDRAAFENALADALEALEPDIVCLAGFMRVLSADFLALAPDRVLNIHPSLLPAFPGLDTHRRAIAAGVRIHGATAHVVRPVVDAGPIIGQAAAPIAPGDSEAAVAKRVLALEHKLYPAALANYVVGAVRVEGDRVVVDPEIAAPDWTEAANPPFAADQDGR